MFENLIKEKIEDLNLLDIDAFAKKNNVFLTNEELQNIFEIIKDHWYELIYGNDKLVFNNNRSKLSNENYEKIEQLFYFFKKKYQRFL